MSAQPARRGPLYSVPASGRVKPGRAHKMALAARRAGCAPGAARDLLELLLRHWHVGGEQFIGGRGTKWFAEELGCCRRSVVSAFDALERAGLVRVVSKGLGGTKSVYAVNLELARVLVGELPEFSPVNNPVNPGEPGALGGAEVAPPPVQKLHHGGAEVAPPNARARSFSRRRLEEGPHTSARTSPQPVDTPPAASDRVPLRSPSSDEKCEHNRTRAQGGCRTCGTNARAAERAARAEQEAAARVERERQRERDELERVERERRRAETSPGAIREALEALKAAKA